jgi:hypothetical protein
MLRAAAASWFCDGLKLLNLLAVAPTFHLWFYANAGK